MKKMFKEFDTFPKYPFEQRMVDRVSFKPSKKNPHAVKLGKLGGLAAGKSMTPEQRKERSRKANDARRAKRSLLKAKKLSTPLA